MYKKTFLDACRKKQTPYTPVWYMRQAGRSLPAYRKLKEQYDILTICRTPELATQVSLMPVDTLGVDAAILFADIMLPLMAMGVDLQIVESVGPVIQTPIRTDRDIESLRRFDPETDFVFLGKTIGNLRDALSNKVPLIGFSGAPFTLASYLIEGKPTREFIKTKVLMYNHPRLWDNLMKKLTKATIQYLQYQIKSGVQALQIFDSWAGYLSREDYATYVLPHSQKIFTALRSSSVPLIHFGTGTAGFLDLFGSVDCDVVGVDWRISLDSARRILPGKALQGNLDPVVLLADFSVIKKKVNAIFKSIDDRTGYIFNLGHGVLPDTPLDTLIKLTDYVHSKS